VERNAGGGGSGGGRGGGGGWGGGGGGGGERGEKVWWGGGGVGGAHARRARKRIIEEKFGRIVSDERGWKLTRKSKSKGSKKVTKKQSQGKGDHQCSIRTDFANGPNTWKVGANDRRTWGVCSGRPIRKGSHRRTKASKPWTSRCFKEGGGASMNSGRLLRMCLGRRFTKRKKKHKTRTSNRGENNHEGNGFLRGEKREGRGAQVLGGGPEGVGKIGKCNVLGGGKIPNVGERSMVQRKTTKKRV